MAILVSLYLGARCGEVMSIQTRHVDQGAGFPRLVLPGTKTENAHRSVRVAEPELWALLCRPADEAKAPTECILPHVQQTLGHGNVKITQRHYMAQQAQHEAQQRATLLVLEGGKQAKTGRPASDEGVSGFVTEPNPSQAVDDSASAKAIA